MFPSVMLLRSRCAEGGWVSKHTAQQIGKEEHQQSTAALHLADCSDNRQGKHSHRERGMKKKDRKRGAEEERRKVKDRQRREVNRVEEDRGRHRQTRKVDERNGERSISCTDVLFLVYMLKQHWAMSQEKQSRGNFRCQEGNISKREENAWQEHKDIVVEQ